MKPRSPGRWLLPTALLLLSALPAAASPRLERLLEVGNAHLDAGRFGAAGEFFTKGRREAAAADDLRWRSRFTFYLGLTEQSRGQSLETHAGLAHLQKAARYYQEVLELRPDSQATRKNLALVRLEIGKRRLQSPGGEASEAMAFFQQALALTPDNTRIHFQLALAYQQQGDREPASAYFARTRKDAGTDQLIAYAQELEELGLWRRAAEFWKVVVEQNPRSSEPHRKMMKLYLEHQAKEIVPYLWDILEAGQSLRAVDGGLEALLAGGWRKETKIELMTVVAAGLARQVDEPRAFPDSYFGQELQKLEDDGDVGAGCRELRAVHVADEIDPGGFVWWRRQGTFDDQEPRHGEAWPLDAFRDLVRALASWFRSRQDFETAEGYYRLALDLHPYSVDLEAFNSLVLLTLEAAGDKETARSRLEELDREYAPALFAAKAESYRRSQQERIFEFHRTLGGLYGALGEWGDESTATSAIFQLDHARKAAEMLDTNDPRAKSRFTPEMANMLAVGYEQVGDSSKSRQVRSEAQAAYRSKGDEESAARILRLDSSSLPQAVLRDRKVRPMDDAAGGEERQPGGGRTFETDEARVLGPKKQELEKLDQETIRKLRLESLRGKDRDGGG